MNYQYRFGASFTTATQILYADGGFGRYYSGLGAALIQGKILSDLTAGHIINQLSICENV